MKEGRSTDRLVTAGDEPYVVATVSCPFTAHVSGSPSTPGGVTFSVLTNEVDLTNQLEGATRGKATSKEVGLTHPVGGMTTQEDANKHFDARLKSLESDQHPLDHDPGQY